MATEKYLKLQEFSTEDLANELAETQSQYKKLKFDHAIKGLENPLMLREMRRDIARLKTESRRREISEMNAEQLSKRTKIRSRRKNK